MQEVIVYRNPMEAAMWKFVMSADFFPIICGIVVFFTVMLTLHSLVSKRYGYFGNRAKVLSNISLVLAAVSGIATIWYMAM